MNHQHFLVNENDFFFSFDFFWDTSKKKKNRKYIFLLIQIEIQRSGENLKKKSTTTFFPLLIFFLKTLSGLILVAMSQKSLASLLKKGIQTKTNFTCPQGGNKDPFD